MVYTYTLTNDIGKVRLLVPDRVQTGAAFTDEEITALLALEGGDVYGGAAAACDVLANDEALAGKVISANGVSTNGVAVGQYFSAKAEKYRARIGSAGTAGGEWVGVASAAVDQFTDTQIGGTD
ncbi:MAG: hypothetical protein GXY82_00760 [Methanospirillum sp.]|nr:hypothetical protein [Methanospirillum sp.]